MTDDPLDAIKARWSHIQGYLQGHLFPWMREDDDPVTEALGRLITTLDVIGLELRSRAAQGAGPASRAPACPRPSFRGQGGPGRFHHQRPDRAPRR